MKKSLLFLTFICSLSLFSQKEANFWFFGENAGLDFNSNPPTDIAGSLSTDEGSASISDSNGVLQFYSDGSTVFSRDGSIMPNGTGLLGNSSSAQSAIIVPKPLDANIYYLFTVGNQVERGGNGVHFSEIDMRLNAGLGDITVKNTPLNGSGNAREKITSVIATACNTFWVITADENSFYTYKVDENGVSVSPTLPNVGHRFLNNLRGYLKLSPDGKILVNASASSGSYIYDFDASTGLISNERTLNIPGDGYGVEFSRDSKQLYLTTGTFSQVNPRTGIRNPASQASLQKYNLDTDKDGVIDDINTINASREEIYRTNAGYRGALQLAADGKIYYARSRQTFLGVINNPEDSGANVNFVEEGLSLNGKICTEGLPPFIQSFFLPIEITDQETGIAINNEDLQLCIGDSKIISPDALAGVTNENYIWSFDNGTTVTEISNSPTIRDLTLTNIDTDASGAYSLKITLTDDCGNPIEYNAIFNIEVFEAASATKPDSTPFCDVDRDGFNSFDLQALYSSEILNGLDNTVFEVVYFNDLTAANTGDIANALPNPYTNPTAFSSETIYARVQNTKAPNACFEITDFNLSVTDLPIPTQPEPYRICDNTTVGTDVDGIVNNFILRTKDAEILRNLNPAQYNVSYHTSLAGAQTDANTDVIDKTTNFEVNNSQDVFVRVENVDNVNCNDTDIILQLIVDPLPVLKANPVLKQCISINNPNPSVNLTNAEFSISETPNVTFEYYEDAAGTMPITDRTSYPVQVNTVQSVYVRVITDQNCDRALVELKINVGQTDENPYNELQPPVCDDLLDADGNDNPATNNDTDGITNFVLDKTAIETEIYKNVVQPANTVVFYYENIEDRANSLNEIDITNYRNDINKIDITTIPEGIQFPIYYKIISTINNDCQGLGEFYLQIHAVPTANTVTDIEECDDALSGNTSDGRNANLNLRSKVAEILGAGQSETDYSVTFHTTESGAMNNTDVIVNDTNYTNNAPAGFTPGTTSEQTIFVRVSKKTGSQCINANTSFKIIIQPLPSVPATISDLIICDTATLSDSDPRNRVAQNIDLTSKSSEILAGRTGYKVEYYIKQEDAENRRNAITSPDDFQNSTDPSITTFPANFSSDDPAVQTIFFIILDENGLLCPSVFSTFQLLIFPEPAIEPISVLSYCDNDDDGDDTNGIIQNIDLNGKIPEILGSNRNVNDYNVSFYLSASDAQTGSSANALPSPYTNSNRTETIIVRVQNKTSLCVNANESFELIINSLPDFTVTTPQIICLNDIPLNIFVENPGDVYSYRWLDKAGAVLGTNDNLDVARAGTYKVIATDNVTLCEREETIVVNPSNVATLDPSFVTVVDEANNLGSQSNLSISIDTINNDLGPGDYQFAILNTDTNKRTPFVGFQDEPLFENLEGGIYQIIVNDKNGCSPDTTLLVSVLQFPKFFTPNGDTQNDTWVVKGANRTFYPNSSINIFNRYGKLVAQIQIDGPGWNGTYNGTLLPSDDYWYNVTLVPSDITKPTINKRGNFSLLRK